MTAMKSFVLQMEMMQSAQQTVLLNITQGKAPGQIIGQGLDDQGQPHKKLEAYVS